MDLRPDPEQRQLVDAMDALFAKHSSPGHVRAAEPLGFDAALWRNLLDVGILAMSASQQAGGWGASMVDLGLVAEQSLYNLADRWIELEVIPACQAYGLALIPWSPLKGGVLGGALAKAAEGRRASDTAQKAIAKHRAALEAYEKLCAEIRVPPAHVAMAWLLANPAVTAPIIGPRTLEQLDTALGALEVRLDESTLSRLDEIFPGYKPSPEVFAW